MEIKDHQLVGLLAAFACTHGMPIGEAYLDAAAFLPDAKRLIQKEFPAIEDFSFPESASREEQVSAINALAGAYTLLLEENDERA